MRRTRPVVWSHGDKIKHLSHFYMQLTNLWSKVCKILQNKWKSHKPMTSQGNGYPRAFNSTKALWGLPTRHSCYRARIKRQLYSQPVFMDPSAPIKPKTNKICEENVPSYLRANPGTWCPGGDARSASGQDLQEDTERLMSESTSGDIPFSESWACEV